MTYFRPFTHDTITQNASHRNIMYLYRGHAASTSLGKVEMVDEESNKKWCCSQKFFYAIFSVTQSFLLSFLWRSDIITASSEKNISKKEPTSVSDITLYLHKNIIIPMLFQCGLFIRICVSINLILSKDVIFNLLWYNVIRWNSHICKKYFFLSFYSFLVKFSE